MDEKLKSIAGASDGRVVGGCGLFKGAHGKLACARQTFRMCWSIGNETITLTW